MDVTKDKCEQRKHSKELLRIEHNENIGDPRTSFLTKFLNEKNTDRKTWKIDNNSILNEVKSFLPKLKEANLKTEERIKNGEDLSIEINGDVSGPVIEMNLALIQQDSENPIWNASTSETSSSESDEDESSSESHSEEEEEETHLKVSEKNVLP